MMSTLIGSRGQEQRGSKSEASFLIRDSPQKASVLEMLGWKPIKVAPVAEFGLFRNLGRAGSVVEIEMTQTHDWKDELI
jgi:hypothetical protein